MQGESRTRFEATVCAYGPKAYLPGCGQGSAFSSLVALGAGLVFVRSVKRLGIGTLPLSDFNLQVTV
jgi:hypothetical protein